MPNLFNGDVLINPDARFVVRDILGVELFALLYTDVDPNGVLDEPAGSFASGPAGTFLSAGGTTWNPITPGGGATTGGVLVWGSGVPWTALEDALATVNGTAIVFVVGEDPNDPTIPKIMTMDPLIGLTDLSGVQFIGIWGGAVSPAQGPVIVDFDATPGLEFQLAAGGILQSKDVLWRYGARVGTGAGPMGRLDWTFDGGGMAPQPGYTSDVVRIGKGATSRVRLRNGARVGDATLIDPMFVVTPFAGPPPYEFVIEALTGSIVGPNTATTPILNPFAPYGVPLNHDASVTIDPGAFTAGSFPILFPLDAAARVSFDPALGGVLTATEVQAAIDELTFLLPPATWADAIMSVSTPVPGTTTNPPAINYFDRSVTIPADALEVGDVLEILAAGEYTTIIVPGFDSASVAVELGTLGFINGNSGPIPYSGCQFVCKVRATVASTGNLGTLLLFQENDFVLQASGVLQYVPQQTGPHNIDTTIAQTIRVRGDWGITTDPGASMVLRTLQANLIKKT